MTDVGGLLTDEVWEACLRKAPSLSRLASQLRGLDAVPLPEVPTTQTGISVSSDFGDVCVSGIPCVDYSLMGFKEQEQGRTLVVIIAWARGLRASRPLFSIVENVVQFKVEILRLLVGDMCDMDSLVACASWCGGNVCMLS